MEASDLVQFEIPQATTDSSYVQDGINDPLQNQEPANKEPQGDQGEQEPLPPSPQKPVFVSVSCQAVPQFCAHEVNTIIAPVKHTGMSHTEGNWPAEVDPTDGEQVARWRKKTERDEDYIRTVLRLGQVVEEIIKQNSALDIYTDYFAAS